MPGRGCDVMNGSPGAVVGKPNSLCVGGLAGGAAGVGAGVSSVS